MRLLLRIEEAAELAGISRSAAYRLIEAGEWPRIRVGRSARIHREFVKQWATEKHTEAQAEAATERELAR